MDGGEPDLYAGTCAGGVNDGVICRDEIDCPGAGICQDLGNPNSETDLLGVKEERRFVFVPGGLYTIEIVRPPGFPAFSVDLVKTYR